MNCCKCSGNGMVNSGVRYVRCEHCGGTGYEPPMMWKRYVCIIVLFMALVVCFAGFIEGVTK